MTLPPVTRICNTPGCGRSCPSREHAYCSDCIGTVLRTGRPPIIERRVPEWVARRNANALPVKDYTRAAA